MDTAPHPVCVATKKLSLRQRLGDPPVDDSLASISWMVRLMAVMAGDIMASNLTEAQKREELLKIADRMAKLRDPDRMYQAERTIRNAKVRQEEPRPGPPLANAPNIDGKPGSVTARRGRPPTK